MSSLNKVICFFVTKYYNNLKYSNRVLSATRIFFERTTKFTQTLSNLGNVYRSSKWSDLSLQNIKFTSLKQYTIIVWGFLLTTLIFFSLVRSYNFSIKDVLLLFTNFLYTLQDLMYYLVLIILSFINLSFKKLGLLIKRALPLPFYKELPTNSASEVGAGPSRTSGTQNQYLPNFKFSSEVFNNSQHNDIMLPTLFLQKSLLLLPKLDYQVPLLSVGRQNYNTLNLVNTGFLRKETPLVLYNNSSNKFLLKNLCWGSKVSVSELDSLSFYRDKKFSGILTVSSNHLALSTLGFMDYKSVTSNISNNLSLAKQSRWLWKSTILSDKVVLGYLPITNLKRLYGNPAFSGDSISRNIWSSNRLNSYRNFLKTPNQGNNLVIKNHSTENSAPSSMHLTTMNSFENSIFWLIKKFYFTQSNQTNYVYVNYDINPSQAGTGNLGRDINFTNLLLFDNSHYQNGLSFNKSIVTTPDSKILLANITSSHNLLFISDLEFLKHFSNITFSKKGITNYYSAVE